jgi:mycoredoxin
MTPRIRMYATAWCPDCHQARRLLNENHIAFEEIDIERNADAEAFVRRVNDGKRRVPTFDVDGRTFHCSPFDPKKLKRELGLK